MSENRTTDFLPTCPGVNRLNDSYFYARLNPKEENLHDILHRKICNKKLESMLFDLALSHQKCGF